MRGERVSGNAAPLYKTGSSPRARGTERHPHLRREVIRFIPACAGNGAPDHRREGDPPVHPRVRGERHEFQFVPVESIGSSPRARGTGPSHLAGVRSYRFIPACAGNGSLPLVISIPAPVHPRVRGERLVEIVGIKNGHGSSPRARGTERQDGRPGHGGRFIPACAGNGRLTPAPDPNRPVHPRVRGERQSFRISGGSGAGSSPRARGTVPAVGGAHVLLRFIPACAGNGCSR